MLLLLLLPWIYQQFDGIYLLTFLAHICEILSNVDYLKELIEGLN